MPPFLGDDAPHSVPGDIAYLARVADYVIATLLYIYAAAQLLFIFASIMRASKKRRLFQPAASEYLMAETGHSGLQL